MPQNETRKVSKAALRRNWTTLLFASASIAFFSALLLVDREALGWSLEGQIGFGVVIFLFLYALSYEFMSVAQDVGLLGRWNTRAYISAAGRISQVSGIDVLKKEIEIGWLLVFICAACGLSVQFPNQAYILLFWVSALAGRFAQIEFDEDRKIECKPQWSNIIVLSIFLAITLFGWLVVDAKAHGLLESSAATAVIEALAVYGGSFFASLVVIYIVHKTYERSAT